MLCAEPSWDMSVSSLQQTASSGNVFINQVVVHHISLQDHYSAVDRDSVRMVMNNMVQAGRLQHVLHHPSLVTMGGVVRQAEHAAMQALSLGDADVIDQEDQGKLISEKVCSNNPWT